MHITFYWDGLSILHFIEMINDQCMLHFIGMTYACCVLLGWLIYVANEAMNVCHSIVAQK